MSLVPNTTNPVPPTDGPDGSEGLIPITNLEQVLDLSWAAQYASEWLEAMHLNENQAVFSVLGMPGMIQPRLADEQGRGRLIDTGDLETSALLAVFAVNYLPNRQKIRPQGLSDTQWNMALHLLNQAAGGEIAPGEINDVPKSFGIDLSTAGGLGELELELAGKPSAFDEINLEVSEDQYIAILSYVRGIKAGNREWVNERVFEIWRDAADENLTAVAEYLSVVERVHALLASVDFAQLMGREERAEFISAVAESVNSVRVLGQEAAAALTELHGMLSVGRQVDLGKLTVSLDQIRSQFRAGGDRWTSFAKTTDLAVGVLIQYVINGVGSAVSAQSAFDSLRSELDQAFGAAKQDAEVAEDLYLQVGRIVKQIVNAPEDGHHPLALTRPEWLRK